jgi:uncharacterized membrane protein
MVITNSLFILKLLTALGCGLIAGVFFAFSVFVMSALARLQPAQGIAAMQSINIMANSTIIYDGAIRYCCGLHSSNDLRAVKMAST